MKKPKIEADIFKDIPRGVPIRDMRKRAGMEMFQVPNAKWMSTEDILKNFPYQNDRIMVGALKASDPVVPGRRLAKRPLLAEATRAQPDS